MNAPNNTFTIKPFFTSLFSQIRNYDDCKRIRAEIVEHGTDQNKVMQEITGFYRFMRSGLQTQYSPTVGLSSALQQRSSRNLDPLLEGLDKFVNDWRTLLSSLQGDRVRSNGQGSIQVQLLGQGTPLQDPTNVWRPYQDRSPTTTAAYPSADSSVTTLTPSPTASPMPFSSNNPTDFDDKCYELHLNRLDLYLMIQKNEPLLRLSRTNSMVYVPLILMDIIDFQAQLIDLYFEQYSMAFGLQFQPHLSRPRRCTTFFRNYKEIFIAQEKIARSAIQNQPNKEIVHFRMNTFLAALNQYGKDALDKARAKL